MAPLGIEVRDLGPRAEMALIGDLDSTGCSTLRCCIEALDRSVSTVVVDLSNLTFIDAAGVGVLLELRDDLEVQLRSLEVTAAAGEVDLVLALTGASEALNGSATSADPLW